MIQCSTYATLGQLYVVSRFNATTIYRQVTNTVKKQSKVNDRRTESVASQLQYNQNAR